MIESTDISGRAALAIVPWAPGDLALLEKLVGDEEMMGHLGGAESPEKIAERQGRYALAGSGMFKIVDAATGEGLGSVGYWERSWRGAQQARLHARRGVRARVPAGSPHALQRLAARAVLG